MFNTEKILSILGKVFAGIAAVAIFLPFLEGVDLTGIHAALVQVIGGIAFVVNAIWRLTNKEGEDATVAKIADATVAKIEASRYAKAALKK